MVDKTNKACFETCIPVCVHEQENKTMCAWMRCDIYGKWQLGKEDIGRCEGWS